MSLPTKTQASVGRLRQYPADLAVVPLLAIVAYLLVLSIDTWGSIRMVAALALILIFPGYAVVSLLFPAASKAAYPTDGPRDRPSGIDTVERLALSLPSSIAIVPLVVMAIAPTSWGLSTAALTTGLVGITVICSQLAVIRRLRLPEGQRYTPNVRLALSQLFGTTDDGAVGTASSILLAVGIVGAAVALTLGLVSPPATAGFSEFALLTEDDDGEFVADGYPTELEPGEAVPIVISIENQHEEEMNYTVLVYEERLEDGEPVERNQIHTMDAIISSGGQVTPERQITPTIEDEPIRVSFLLFYDDPHADPTRDSADYDAHLWMIVSEDESISLAGESETDGGAEAEADNETAAEDDSGFSFD